jgi:hypothetical protein
MGKVTGDMSMSLEGFIAGRREYRGARLRSFVRKT